MPSFVFLFNKILVAVRLL